MANCKHVALAACFFFWPVSHQDAAEAFGVGKIEQDPETFHSLKFRREMHNTQLQPSLCGYRKGISRSFQQRPVGLNALFCTKHDGIKANGLLLLRT